MFVDFRLSKNLAENFSELSVQLIKNRTDNELEWNIWLLELQRCRICSDIFCECTEQVARILRTLKKKKMNLQACN